MFSTLEGVLLMTLSLVHSEVCYDRLRKLKQIQHFAWNNVSVKKTAHMDSTFFSFGQCELPSELSNLKLSAIDSAVL